MAQLYLRLVLTNNSVIEAGSDWVDVHGNVLAAKVGAIFYTPETLRSYSTLPEGADENALGGGEDEDDGGEEINETISAHYEVWAMPNKGSAMVQANETLCRKVPATSVLYAEEIWPLSLASKIVQERVREMAEMAKEMLGESDQNLATQAAATEAVTQAPVPVSVAAPQAVDPNYAQQGAPQYQQPVYVDPGVQALVTSGS